MRSTRLFSSTGANTFSTQEKSASTGSCTLTALASSPAVAVTNTDTWTGGTSTDWNLAGNWDFNVVPGTLNDVAIPNVGAQPALSSNPTVNSLNLANGRTLTMTGHTLTITGSTGSDLTLDGTLSGGGLSFGTGTHAISNGGGTGSITPTNTTTVLTGANVTLNNDLQMDSLTISGGGTLNISSRTLSLKGSYSNSGTFTVTGSTVIFNGAGAQSIGGSAPNFNNLTISNSANTVSLGANTSITGNLLVNTGGILDLLGFTANRTASGGQISISSGAMLKIGGANTFPANYNAHLFGGTSTVDYDNNSNLAQTISAEAYGNLMCSGNGARTLGTNALPNGGVIGIFTTFTPGTHTYTITGSTIEYNSTTADQALPSSGFNTYNNLTINNTKPGGGVVTGFTGLTVNGLLDVKGGTLTGASTFNNVQIDSGATLSGTNGTTMNVSGNWTNNGTFTANGNTVNLNGNNNTQTLTGSTSFNNLSINHTGMGGVTFANDMTVNGTLTLNSNLDTGGNTLIQNNALPTMGSGDVIGNVKRSNSGSPLLTGTAYTFGNPFNTVTFDTGVTPTDLTFNLVMSAPADFTTAVKRTYTITATGGAVFTAALQLHYLDADLNLNDEQNLKLWRKDAVLGWQNQGALNHDPVNNWVRKTNVATFSPWTLAADATPTAANGNVSGRIVDGQGRPVEGAGVRMTGTQNRLAVTDANGNYNFDDVETNGFYTVRPSRANFSFTPTQRSFSQLGLHTDAAFDAAANGEGANALDRSEYFVRQQYVDFLNREPDEAGLTFWVNNIESCGADAVCREAKRTDTSAAFFLSIEFQQTGYLVYRTYQAAYGDIPNTPVPVRLGEFQPDTRAIGKDVVVNQGDWQQTLDNNKQAFMTAFVGRSRFLAAYPTTMMPDQFVDKLFANAGVIPSPTDRATAIDEFGLAMNTTDAAARARAVRDVAENSTLQQQEFDRAFVLMQYFGYLRRDPNSGADRNFDGYNFWLTKLDTFNGNFRQAEMVQAFLVSHEYRGRFPR